MQRTAPSGVTLIVIPSNSNVGKVFRYNADKNDLHSGSYTRSLSGGSWCTQVFKGAFECEYLYAAHDMCQTRG